MLSLSPSIPRLKGTYEGSKLENKKLSKFMAKPERVSECFYGRKLLWWL